MELDSIIMAKRLVVLATLLSAAVSQEISTTDCGSTKECLKSPSSCTSSADCDFLVTYKRRSADAALMDFEMSSTQGSGYLALGFNSANVMPGSSGEICQVNNGKNELRGFEAPVRSTPNLVTLAPNTIMHSLEIRAGAMICRFSRPLSPSSYQKSLLSAINVLMATGDVFSGQPGYHARRIAFGSFDLSAFAPLTSSARKTTQALTKIMPTTTTTKMPADNKMVTTTVLMRMKTKEPGIMMTTTTAELGVAMRTPVAMVAMVNSTSMERSSSQHKSSASKSMSDIASTMSMNSSTAVVSTSRTMPTTAPATMIDLTNCGKTKGCFRLPTTCSNSNTCNFIVTWQPDMAKQQVAIELQGTGTAWVAFGLNKATKGMTGTYGESCFKLGSGYLIKPFYAASRNAPSFSYTQPNGIAMDNMIQNDQRIICRYTRPYRKTDSNSIDVNDEFYIVVASGNAINNGNPSYHSSNRGVSNRKFNITKAIGSLPGNVSNKVSVGLIAVIGCILMTLIAVW